MNAEPIEYPCGPCRIGHLAGRCWAKAMRNRRLCDLVAGDDGYLELVRTKSGADPEAVPAPPPRPTVAEVLALQRRARSCPHFTRLGCGCAAGRCLAGRGNLAGHVALDDCRNCPQLPPEASP